MRGHQLRSVEVLPLLAGLHLFIGALNAAGKDELGNSLSVLDNFNAGSNFSVTKDAVLYSQLSLCWLLRQFGRQANLQGITTSTDF